MPEETVVEWHCDFAQTEDFQPTKLRIADSSARDQCLEAKSPDETEQ